jgi:2-dehydro-3-deoxyphosphogluconate aldolase/(4S)-4-hydroxy-2-oxoglutarate aldolase
MEIVDVLSAGPVLPILVIHDLKKAVPLAEALVAGGIKVLEVTLRTPVAMQAVSDIARALPDAIVGVGTLTRPEQFSQAADAGAQFAVSPGFTHVLLKARRQSALPYLPGVFTPSEVMAARDEGFEYLKLYPTRQAGGIGMIKALSGLFSELRFCPTGGIGAEDFRSYLELPSVVCVGGSWVAPAAAIEAGDWDTITRLASEAQH